MNRKMLDGDIRNMWRLIKRQVKSANNCVPIKGIANSKGIKSNNEAETLDLWKEHFQILAKREKHCIISDINTVENDEVCKETDKELEWNEVRDVLIY